MLWSSWSYNKGRIKKVAVCNDHHKSYNEGGNGKVAVCSYRHELITAGIQKGCGM